MKLYKLTDKEGKTRNDTQWADGVTNEAKKSGKGELCSEYYIHAYTHPLLAVFLNPIYGDIKDYRLWEAKGRIAKTDYGLKVGCKSLTTIKEIEPPQVTLVNKIAFGILCALEVNEDPRYKQWAENWLSGKDRSAAAATLSASAAWTARAAAEAAEAARAWAAAWTARAAVEAARAWAVAEAARAAAEAARAAGAGAAAKAAGAGAAWAAKSKPLDLIKLAEKAMEVK